MAKKLHIYEKTPEEIAFDNLKSKFIKEGFRCKKRQVMDVACKKCGYDNGNLVNVTYQNGEKKKVIAVCTHCGYEGDPVVIEQFKLL